MWRIAVVFGLFMTFVISIVVYTAFLDIDLVAEDYYQQEVNYQEIIDAKKNSVELKKQLAIQQNGTTITIRFPESHKRENMNGTIHFYHPKSSKFDVQEPLKLSENNTQTISKSKLLKGNYTVKFQWEKNGKRFYIEKSYYVS
ncbi:MAG: FixH family protein [Flavobacteriales bacterium]|nr:FixH family protein [Flavobacteriales bacterium]